MVTKLKFGKTIRHKKTKYFVTDVGKRVVKARKVFPDDKELYPNGRLSNVITTIKIKDL
jgi:hypothetical protein